jgi:hypothetical protein
VANCSQVESGLPGGCGRRSANVGPASSHLLTCFREEWVNATQHGRPTDVRVTLVARIAQAHRRFDHGRATDQHQHDDEYQSLHTVLPKAMRGGELQLSRDANVVLADVADRIRDSNQSADLNLATALVRRGWLASGDLYRLGIESEKEHFETGS